MSTKTRFTTFSRRSFVEKLGLGVGAALLAPIARSLVREAHGQASDRKIAMFWLAPNGINPYWMFTPAEFIESGVDLNGQEPGEPTVPVLDGPKNYTWPEMFKALEPYRQQMLLIDGLKSHAQVGEDAGHGNGFMALGCTPLTPNPGNPDFFIPGGITFDQHLAKSISSSTVRRSVLIAQSSKPDDEFKSNMFAEDRNKPLPAFQSPTSLYKDLFGDGMAQAAGVGTEAPNNRLLFEGIRYDLSRLESSFAGEEKAKLASYLGAMEAFEKSESLRGSLTCTGGTMPADGKPREASAAIEAMHAMASVALTCGMTNVLGVDIGCGGSHDFGPNMERLLIGTPLAGLEGTSLADVGHLQREVQGPVNTILYQWLSGMIAQTIEAMKAIPSGSGNLFDTSLTLLTSDNAEAHHSQHARWPLALIGNVGGRLKADGRYIRYPGGDSARALVDMFSAIGAAFGVPDTGFATTPLMPEFTKGPLELLMP